MSAVPNVPEHLLDLEENNATAASAHWFKAKERVANAECVNNDVATADGIVNHVIGAGYSGVYCGIRIPEKLRNCELVIYEKNAGTGGTWYENRYVGAACDVPSHSYQFSFNPKHDRSSMYAPGPEIREYIESTAKKYGADRFIRLQHEVVQCRWEQNEGKWHVRIRRPDGDIFDDCSDVLVTARGLLNDKQWPKIDGLGSFNAQVMHSAAWDDKCQFDNKRIAVIGGGSSAIQIVPHLQKVPGAQLECFIRSKTWISPPFGQQAAQQLGMGDTMKFPPDVITRFKSDPSYWHEFRVKVEADSNNIHAITLKGSAMQKGAQQMFDDAMKKRLAKKPEYYDLVRSTFAPGCKRLTPGPGFLEALVEDNVSFIQQGISHIEPKGIVTEDGELHEIVILIAATEFHASAAPPFEVRGLNNLTLKQHWHDRATNYLSLATDSFPTCS